MFKNKRTKFIFYGFCLFLISFLGVKFFSFLKTEYAFYFAENIENSRKKYQESYSKGKIEFLKMIEKDAYAAAKESGQTKDEIKETVKKALETAEIFFEEK